MFITHDFGVVAEIADSVVVMEKGRIVEQGSAEQVLQSPIHPYTRRLIAAVPRLTGEDRIPQGTVSKAMILKVEGLAKTYRSGSALFGSQRVVPAVNDVSFDLAPGRTLGIVGESGSGKSSLGRLLDQAAGQRRRSRSYLRAATSRSFRESDFRPLRPRIQMIFQDPFASLNPRSTIGHILTVGPSRTACPMPRRVKRRRRCCPMSASMPAPSAAIRTSFPVGNASASASPEL